LTAPCVAAPVDNTLLFDVGADPWADEAVDEVRNLNVVDEVELRVTPTVGDSCRY
jgi:hypothetical protein